ncbi:MAG: hypothetical protein H8E28_03875 [Anaerolineae bacterium]|nr:hypothetical protein [Anaerolineae bacterium]
MRNYRQQFRMIGGLLIALVWGAVALMASRSEDAVLAQDLPTATPRPTDVWFGLLQQSPYPHTTPLPDAEWSAIDGTYAMLDPSEPQWWACRRCADYRPAGGVWKLQFDRGVMRIYYDVTGWYSMASYRIEGEQLLIFNDPYCPEDVGEYTWKLEDRWNLDKRSLVLTVVDDTCSIRLRGQNLSRADWLSCMPPNVMTGASDHWHKPPGCEANPVPDVTIDPDELMVRVNIYPGYARHYATPPDFYADANGDGRPAPEGVVITRSDNSIPYGLSRVLWGTGSWVQTATTLPLNAIGVQIYGAQTIGWARVLFDDTEIWRGDTAEIGSQLGYFGGYIEVSGFPPGAHVLRVESLGFDYHPVTVAFFGFSLQNGVSVGGE